MLPQVFELSLIITGIYICFQQGNILGGLRIAIATGLDKICPKVVSRYIQKPLFDCLPCMASLWTIVITGGIDVWLMLAVCGLNAVMEQLIPTKD